MAKRVTIRKRVMQEVFWDVFRGRPTLLEEFRWRVLLEEGLANGRTATCLIDNSIRNSFNESLHRLNSPVNVVKTIYPIDELPIGLLARSAVWRQPSMSTILTFLAGARIVTFSVAGAVVDDQGIEKRIRLVRAKLTTVPGAPTTQFPASRGLFFVGNAPPDHWDFVRLAGVPWRLQRERDGDIWEIEDAELNFEET